MTSSLPLSETNPQTIWFAPRSCIVNNGVRRDVVVGDILLGSFGPKEYAKRNLLVVSVAQDPDVHLGKLARGAGLSPEAVRQLRRLHDEKGVEALVQRKRGGGTSGISLAMRHKLAQLFEGGASVSEAHAALGKRVGCRATVGRIRAQWAAARAGGSAPSDVGVAPPAAPSQKALPAGQFELAMMQNSANLASSGSGMLEESGTEEAPAAEEPERHRPRAPESLPLVQHLGTWLIIASVHALGLHRRAQAAANGRVKPHALRLALDAAVAALALGQGCVEGVRRLATASAAALLLSSRAPSPSWVRRTLGSFSVEAGGAALHLGMARQYVERARAEAEGEGPVFYVDNHMRTYTGKHVIRKGWRMQDKRVRPGASDYYVHDEDGRPIGRTTAPQHGSLTDFLSPIACLLKLALPDDAILLAFDRAGAFVEQMAKLRNGNIEFVTYERRPYALLGKSEFTETLLLDGERLQWCEPHRKNLGGGRGRVRRICVLTEEGRQVNLVANSTRPAPRLIEVMRGRWGQENGFKHGAERWGLNQLDGRTVHHYPEGTVIPNPARRRLDNALRIARIREGNARIQLAPLSPGDIRREKLERELAEAMNQQRELLELRPSMPTHAPLEETELAGKLVHHELEYKLTMDTIRIACANAESELAAMLAPCLPRAAEAKKTLANLFAAPGRVHVGPKAITITLSPAGTARETQAFGKLAANLTRHRLTLPGDQAARPLRVRIAQQS
jgi:hypothetical protein